ncbi:Sentrin-specific protease 1 [Bienertia sinuspersici]
MNERKLLVVKWNRCQLLRRSSIYIPDLNDGDSFATKSEDSTIRTLQQWRNNYVDELTLEEGVLVDSVFYSEYEDVSRISIDEYDPIVSAHNAKLRFNLESSVLLEIVNPVNPEIPVYACSYKFIEERKKSQEIPKDFGSAYFHFCFLLRQSMSSWEKLFPNNNIRDADLIFVPAHLDNHFTVLVLNVDKKPIEDIDNRSDNKHFKRYGEEPYDRVFEMCRVLQSFLQGNRINRRCLNGLHHWKRRTISFPWRSNQNIHDCGIYSVNAMKWYDGGNEKMEPISTFSTIRKDKERHLLTLPPKRVEKVFEEDQKIREDRARHEKEVDDFLNDNCDDSTK